MSLTAAQKDALNTLGITLPELKKGQWGPNGSDIQLGDMLDAADRTNLPKVVRVLGGGALSIAAIPAAATITGTDLLQGQVLDSYTFGTGTSSVLVKANRPGVSGVRVRLVDAAAASIVVATKDITANYRGPLNGNVDNANAVAALINADADAVKLVHATGGGTGNVVAAGYASLTGGTHTTDAGLSVKINDIEQDIINTPTETSIALQTLDFTGLANLDQALLEITSNGKVSEPFAVRIIT